ncbi:MAG: response regulator [Chloroflexi bacterium]|nr:MAG: response regulator [Chloroflexota bacterium]
MFDPSSSEFWTILVVDDEPDNVDLVAESLEFFGATVRTAANGVEALECLKDFKPDLILLDLSMPKMDGWELRRHVKANPDTASIPVVALSAHAMTGDKERALEVGFDGYLTKPIHVATLVNDIRAALRDTGAKVTALVQSDNKAVLEASQWTPQEGKS